MFGLGMGELTIIFLVIFMLFGAKNLPEIAKGMGKAVREFRKAASEVRQGIDIGLVESKESPKKISADAEAVVLQSNERKVT